MAPGGGQTIFRRSLQGDVGCDRQDVIVAVFQGMKNCTCLYQLMLKGMRDSAGNAGEFYMPRPVVQLMKVLYPPTG